MATYTFPSVTPNESTVELVSNTAIFQSPLSGAIQTIDRSGERLVMTLFYRSLTTANRALLVSFIAKMNGHQHRATVPFHAVDNQGAFGGTPLVNGASQTGNSLDIDGASNNITGWIKAGDFFSVNGELKIATADANSDGSGNVTLSFAPRLRTSPSDGASVETTAPSGTFLLMDSRQGWNYRPGKFSDFTLKFVEDIAA